MCNSCDYELLAESDNLFLSKPEIVLCTKQQGRAEPGNFDWGSKFSSDDKLQIDLAPVRFVFFVNYFIFKF